MFRIGNFVFNFAIELESFLRSKLNSVFELHGGFFYLVNCFKFDLVAHLVSS